MLLAVALAGCLGGGGKAVETPSSSAGEDDPATLTGIVTNDEHLPIVGANITVSPANETDTILLSLITDAAGGFQLGPVPAGVYLVTFQHVDFEPLVQTYTLKPGYNGYVDVHLFLLENRKPSLDAPEAWAGYYDCGWEFVILTGDCMILYENVTCELGDCQESPVMAEDNAYFFNVTERWSQIVIELVWEEGGQNQLDGMHLYLARPDSTGDAAAHHVKYAVAEGPDQPLRIDVFPDAAHESAEIDPQTGAPIVLTAAGGALVVLGLPRGHFSDQTGQVCNPSEPDRCFLGVGAALDLSFTVYVSVFYNQLAPDGYTRLPPP
jgi:hypothetical protein